MKCFSGKQVSVEVVITKKNVIEKEEDTFLIARDVFQVRALQNFQSNFRKGPNSLQDLGYRMLWGILVCWNIGQICILDLYSGFSLSQASLVWRNRNKIHHSD